MNDDLYILLVTDPDEEGYVNIPVVLGSESDQCVGDYDTIFERKKFMTKLYGAPVEYNIFKLQKV